MQVMHEVCCGLDVHKKSVTACVVWAMGRRHQTREFGTSSHRTAFHNQHRLSNAVESTLQSKMPQPLMPSKQSLKSPSTFP